MAAVLSKVRSPGRPIRGAMDNRWVRWFGIAVVIVAAFAFPQMQGDAGLSVAYVAEVYVLLALGLNVVIGYAGLLDLGYAAFFAIGAYTGATLASSQFSVGSRTISNAFFSIGPDGIHVNFFLLIPAAALIAAIFGITFGAPTLRLRGDYLAIVTLGFGEIVPNVVKNLGASNYLFLGRHQTMPVPNLTNGVNSIVGIDPPPPVHILGINWNFSGLDLRPWYYLALIIICLSVVMLTRLKNSRLGRSWVAMREDEIAAAHAGINITGTRLTAFAIGASFSGFGGLLYASQLSNVNYTSFFFSVSVTILVMVILGGMGSIPGVIVGGIIIAYLSQTWLDKISSDVSSWGHRMQHWFWPLGGHLKLGGFHVGSIGTWLGGLPLDSSKPMIYGIILVSIMLLRPQGLWPSRRRARELRPATPAEAAAENEDLRTLATGEI
jgi:branched-chain amino acid transport system permease protein